MEKQKKILIIEKGAKFSSDLAVALAKENFVCDFESSCSVAAGKLLVNKFDLVIIDIGGGNLDQIRKIKTRLQQMRKMIPIIVLSNVSRPEAIRNCLTHAFLTRPFDNQTLIQTINRILHKGEEL